MNRDTISICEVCGKEIKKDYRKDKKFSASHSLRFCSRSCANKFSSRNKRNETNKKISRSMKGKSAAITWEKTPELMQARILKMKRTCKNKSSKKLYRTAAGVTLDKTRGEIDSYKEIHLVCEICGKENILSGRKVSLCVDHNHKNNSFRGVLCSLCNRQLGWYENNREKIEFYLNKGSMV